MNTLQDPTVKPKTVGIVLRVTRLTGAGVELLSYNTKGGLATHWSIYKHLNTGALLWVADIPIQPGKNPGNYYSDALLAGAKLSMEYGAPIEAIH